jgi:hypothetical protein
MASALPPDDSPASSRETSEGGPASNPEPQGSGSLNSFTSSGPERTGPQLVKPAEPGPPSPVAIWIDRIGLVIKVVFYIELGMLLAILPWMRVWTDNGLVAGYPQFRAFLQLNFVRGVVTGIGLVDIWIGIWEAVHYRDPR